MTKNLQRWQVAYIRQTFADDSIDADQIEEIIERVDELYGRALFTRTTREVVEAQRGARERVLELMNEGTPPLP